MRARKNEATLAILIALGTGEHSAQTIAAALNTQIPKVSMILLKLVGYGQVTRRKVQDGEITVDADEGVTRPRYIYLYTITGPGHQRIEYLKTMQDFKASLAKKKGKK